MYLINIQIKRLKRHYIFVITDVFDVLNTYILLNMCLINIQIKRLKRHYILVITDVFRRFEYLYILKHMFDQYTN